MKKYPDGHFELVVVEVTAEDGAFNDAVKGPYQLLNALWNTYIRYIDRQHHRQQHVIHPTLNSFSTHYRSVYPNFVIHFKWEEDSRWEVSLDVGFTC